MKLRNTLLLLALAALAASAALPAQSSADPASQYSQYQTQPQAAPVERQPSRYAERSSPGYNDDSSRQGARPQPITTQPAQGIVIRSTMPVQTVPGPASKVELRLNHGIANVTVHKPARGTLIQLDMPAGQTVLIHDGLYLFNADTATVRVLHGKAEAYPSPNPTAKGIVLKEDHQLTFGAHPQVEDLNLADLRSDLLTNPASGDHGYGGYPYGYAPYGYPYYAYDYPWGYPYGWGWGGYPYLGLGFGYYGGFGRGFYGGGFHGGGFHGHR